MAERDRVVDVGRRDLQLLRQVRREADDAREEALHVAGQRLDLLRLRDHVGLLDELADEVRLVERTACEANAADSLHEHAHRSVGDADHLVHDRRRPDLVEVVPARRVGRLGLDRDQREQPVAADDIVDQLDRPLLADRERRHRLREDDGLLQRQHGKRRGQLGAELVGLLLLLGADDDLILRLAHRRVTSIGSGSSSVLRSATGSTTFSIPRSYVATARAESTASPRSIRRWNAPYSISMD